MYGKYSRGVSNQERVIVARVRYVLGILGSCFYASFPEVDQTFLYTLLPDQFSFLRIVAKGFRFQSCALISVELMAISMYMAKRNQFY